MFLRPRYLVLGRFFLLRQNHFPSCCRIFVLVLPSETQEKQNKFKSNDYVTPEIESESAQRPKNEIYRRVKSMTQMLWEMIQVTVPIWFYFEEI